MATVPYNFVPVAFGLITNPGGPDAFPLGAPVPANAMFCKTSVAPRANRMIPTKTVIRFIVSLLVENIVRPRESRSRRLYLEPVQFRIAEIARAIGGVEGRGDVKSPFALR